MQDPETTVQQTQKRPVKESLLGCKEAKAQTWVSYLLAFGLHFFTLHWWDQEGETPRLPRPLEILQPSLSLGFRIYL